MKFFGTCITEFFEALYLLSYQLIIAKLNAYRFNLPALKLMHIYLIKKRQKTIINQDLSSRQKIIFGVIQGFTFGPILLKIFLNDLFLILPNNEIESYADDNNIGDSGQGVKTLCLVYIFLAGKGLLFSYIPVINHTPTYILNSFSCQKNVNKARVLYIFILSL